MSTEQTEKRVSTRVVSKHGLASEWALATNFKPLKGEIIVYDPDDTYDHARIKVGDGENIVDDLPFAATYDLTAPSSKTNGDVTINLTASGSTGDSDSITIKGTGATSVTTDDNGVVTISSTDTNTETTLTIDAKEDSDTEDIVYALIDLQAGGEKGHDLTAMYAGLPTKAYVDKMVTGTVEYLGTVSALTELSLTAGQGDFYRVSTQFAFGSETAHVGDILLATKDNPTQSTSDWDLIHTEVDSNTWTANSSTADGYVAKTNGAKNHVWKTDENGVPAWRKDVPITAGAGEGSLVINEGDAVGEASIAGGTTDTELIASILGEGYEKLLKNYPNITNLPDWLLNAIINATGTELTVEEIRKMLNISPSEAEGILSISLGASNKSISVGSTAMGFGNVSGAKGYYISAVNQAERKLTLSIKQDSNTSPVNPITWETDDTLVIVNGDRYYFSVESVEGNVVTVSGDIPFSTLEELKQAVGYNLTNPNERSIINVNKPDAGEVVFGWGATSIGSLNTVTGSNAYGVGYKNIVAGDFGTAFGQENVVTYSSFATGIHNGAIGRASFASGDNTEASGEVSNASGKETVANNFATHAEGHKAQATGVASHAEGYGSAATSYASHAEGQNCETTGSASHAEGNGTKAKGVAAHSEGNNTNATADYSHAEGESTTASGGSSHAEGSQTKADAHGAHAEGTNIESPSEGTSKLPTREVTIGGKTVKIDGPAALGRGSHAEGVQTLAYAYASHSEGIATDAVGEASHAEGQSTTATGWIAHAEGEGTKATAKAAHAEGGSTKATSTYSHAEGQGTTASNFATHAEGQNTNATGWIAHAEGYSTTSDGTASHTEGHTTKTGSGNGPHAEGYFSEATGDGAHAEGYSCNANGEGVHSEGYDTTATGKGTHAEGVATEATGDGAHAEGQYSQATGIVAHAEGDHSRATGDVAHAEGGSTEAKGYASHAEGGGTRAWGQYSHSEGHETIADAHGSHAEGTGMQQHSSDALPSRQVSTSAGVVYITGPAAYGRGSHAEGAQTFAGGYASHSEGYITDATGAYSHAEGQRTKANADAAHAEGYATVAHAHGSHAEGTNVQDGGGTLGTRKAKYNGPSKSDTLDVTGPRAHKPGAHAEGVQTLAYHYASHAEGRATDALREYSHAEGYYTIANGAAAHAEGENTWADSNGAHAEGTNISESGGYLSPRSTTYRKGNTTVSVNGPIAYNRGSHAEGVQTFAANYAAHAEGLQTEAQGVASHAEGERTIAKERAQTAIGKYNADESTALFIVGDGAVVTRSYASNQLSIYNNSDNTLYRTEYRMNMPTMPSSSSIIEGTINITTEGVYVYTITCYTGTNVELSSASYVGRDISSTISEGTSYITVSTQWDRLSGGATVTFGTTVLKIAERHNALTVSPSASGKNYANATKSTDAITLGFLENEEFIFNCGDAFTLIN